MNVLAIVHYPVFGGPHNQALRLAGPLDRRGWRLTTLIPDEPGNAAAYLREGGVEVIQAPLHRLRAAPDPRLQARTAAAFAPEVQAIRRIIRDRQIDLVLVGGLVNPHAAVAARLEGVPLVWQILDTRAPAPLRRALMPLVTRWADAVMSTGLHVARVHPGALALGPRLVPFFPPVDTRRFRPGPDLRAEARRALDVPPEAPLVGTVANINPQKGHEYFVRAAALIRRARPEARFRVLGASTPTQSAYEARVRAEADAAGLSAAGCLRWVDPGAGVHTLLPAFDLFLLTSVPRSEGVPTVILEAMACGVPVVATDVGAVREVVEEGVTGFVVPPLDPAAIAAAALRLLRDPDLRRRMGEEGRRRAVERYDAEVCAETHVRAFEAAIAHHRARRARSLQAPPAAPREAAAPLRDLLVCPACRGPLAWEEQRARCRACARAYPVEEGIPILLLDRAAAAHDELDHLHGPPRAHAHAEEDGHDHRRRQAAFFDRAEAAEFEIERPHGAPALYGWLLGEKFRRAVAGIEHLLPGAVALSVCAGSAMDAEFFARAGARVIAADLSLGAARRAAERARRYALPILPVVADVERLPFADASVDLVTVHDGLHHLRRPADGLAEMARVARRAVSVSEPARAAVTAVAVRLGWALAVEEAGNRVARLTPAEVAAALRTGGFRVRRAERYAMYYRHQPGRLTRLLSRPGLFALSRAALHAANALAGPLGNKLAVVAVRRPTDRRAATDLTRAHPPSYPDGTAEQTFAAPPAPRRTPRNDRIQSTAAESEPPPRTLVPDSPADRT